MCICTNYTDIPTDTWMNRPKEMQYDMCKCISTHINRRKRIHNTIECKLFFSEMLCFQFHGCFQFYGFRSPGCMRTHLIAEHF
jgi:hypothetical protein